MTSQLRANPLLEVPRPVPPANPAPARVDKPTPVQPDDPLLAALVTLTELLQAPCSAEALTAGLPLPDGKLTPELALRATERAGFGARLIERPLAQIAAATLPCILLLRDGGACILAALPAAGRATVLLPETGRGTVELPLAELAARHAGGALLVRPTLRLDQRAELVPEAGGAAWFWGPITRAWPVYAEVAVAAVMINLFALASPLFVMNVYDRVVPNAALESLWALALGAGLVFLFDFLLRGLRGYFVDCAGRVADLQIAARIFEQVLGLRLAARSGSAGAFASNLREFESLRDFFASSTLVALVDLPFVLFFVLVIWLIGGPVALVPALAIPAVLGLGLALQRPLERTIRQTFKESAAKHGLLVETIHGLETLKSVGAEGRTQRLWERYVDATAASSLRARFLSALGVNAAVLAQNLTTVGVVVVGVYRIADGLMSVGALVACTIIAGRAMAPLGQVAGILTRLHQARAAFEALDELMRRPVERPAGRRFLHRPKLGGALELRGVRFAYPGQKTPVLDQLSVRIAPGERVGLIGRIGSGKSTVGRLLLGLHEPDQGAVLVDGTDLRQIDPADLRRNIGALLQDVVLFHGTVRDNIALGAAHADDRALLAAARIAGVEDFIAQHPLGFDLPVGERGEALSGGQRQAVALARALVQDPPILVLDEPTSAMDQSSEHRFKQRLAASLAGRTLLIVTHRASLLSLVDRVIVLEGGRIAADGPREEVVRALAAGQVRAPA
jgi:ATP-binding cassette subfamily C protein LapB